MRNCSRTNWRELLQRHHTAAYADSGYDPIFGESAGDELIREVQGKIGLEMPIELTDLYRSVDGYGLEMDPESMLSPWLLVPCSMLPDFISQNRDVIAGTHPSLASRFLPLIDLVNGDSIGYVFAQNGLLIDGLHMSCMSCTNTNPIKSRMSSFVLSNVRSPNIWSHKMREPLAATQRW